MKYEKKIRNNRLESRVKEKPNVLFVRANSDSVGGQDIALVNRIKGLESLSFHCRVALPSHGILSDLLKSHGIEVLIVPLVRFSKKTPFIFFKSIVNLIKIIKEHNITLLHCSGAYPGQYSIPASKICRIPCVISIETMCYSAKTFYNSLLKYADMVITVSKSVEQLVKKYSGIKRKKIITVHNPLYPAKMIERDINEKSISLRETFGISPNTKLVGAISRIDPIKGLEYFIKMAALVKKEIKDVKFVIVGSTHPKHFEYKKQIMRLCNTLLLESDIIFVEFQRDILPYINMLDVCVLPSLNEGLPGIIIEALALHKPIVATNVGGVSESLGGGKFGLLTEPKNPESLSQAVIKVLNNLEKYKKVAALGKKFAFDNFTQNIHARKIADVYTILVRKSKEFSGVSNVLFYESSSGYGGSASALANMVKYLDRSRFNPILAFREFGPQLNKIKDIDLIKLKTYREAAKLSFLGALFYFTINILPEAIRLCSIIQHKKIDIVHINTSVRAGIPAIIAAKLSGISCISHTRNSRKMLKREVFFAKWLDRCILLNNEAYKMNQDTLNADKVDIIYDGVELDKSLNIDKEKVRKEFSLGANYAVGLVGRIVNGKGHKEFILSAKQILQKMPNVKFLIVGDVKGDDNSYFTALKELVLKEKLETNIVFTGWRNDISNVVSVLTVLVLPSTTFPEGLPNTIIEAMALEKPVVATSIPGPNEIVLDNKTGFLIPPGDIQALTDKIIYLLDNPDVAKRMGERGRERVREQFDIRKTVKKLENIYSDVIEENANKKLKKSFAYNVHRLLNYISSPLSIMRMQRIAKKKNAFILSHRVAAMNGSFILLDDFIADESAREQIKKSLESSDEFLLGEIDQDSRVLSQVGILPYFENVTKNDFIPRVRYKLQIIALKVDNNFVIAIKKYFGKDRLGFAKEVFILDRLSSCNVPRLLKTDGENNIIYMSLIPGVSLRDALWTNGAKVKDIDYMSKKNRQKLTHAEIGNLKLESGKRLISKTVDTAFIDKLYGQIRNIHARGVLLEDIKYGNIIINERNEPFFIDFHSAEILNKRSNTRSNYVKYKEIETVNKLLGKA